MSFTEKRLYGPQGIIQMVATPPSTTGDYAVPANKTAIVKQILVTNTDSSTAYFKMWVGGTSPSDVMFNDVQVNAYDTLVVNLSLVLNSEEGVWFAGGSFNGNLNVTMSGVENDGPLNPNAAYIADDSITTPKIADSAVTSDKIAPFSIVNSKLETASVTSDKTSFTDTNFAGTVTADLALIDGTSYPGISHVQMRILPSLNNIGAGISMQATGAGARGWSIVSTGPSATQGAGAFLVYRDTSDGGGASLWIDSSGRMRTPYRPAFRYHGWSLNSSGFQGGTAPLNVGGHLTIGSGATYSRFTAPIAGIYVFGFSILINETGLRYEAIMRKNGTSGIDGYNYYSANDYSNATNAYSNAVNTYVVSLAANDYVDWSTSLGTAYPNTDRGDRQFWGYLLG